MKRIGAPVTMAVLLAALAGVGAGCSEHKISDRDLVLIEPKEALEVMEGGPKLLGLGGGGKAAWVDPRSGSEFRAGHIPDAISLPFQNVTAEHRRLKAFDTLIVYGNDYQDPKSQGMSKRLLELGFKDVRTLRGGLRAWTDAGFEVEEGAGVRSQESGVRGRDEG